MEYPCFPNHDNHERPASRFVSLNKHSSPHTSIGCKSHSVGALTVFICPGLEYCNSSTP